VPLPEVGDSAPDGLREARPMTAYAIFDVDIQDMARLLAVEGVA